MSKFSKALKKLRKNSGYTQKQLADLLGVSESAVGMYERGQREPNFKTLEALAAIFNVTMSDLIEEQSAATANSRLSKEAHRILKAYENAPRREQRIVSNVLEPYMEKPSEPDNVVRIDFNQSDQRASAGRGIPLDDESMSVRKARLDALPAGYQKAPGRYFGVPVAGDSMEPKFHDGDILIVSREPVNVGEIGVFTMDGEGYVKKLGRGVLHSLNIAYADIPLTEGIRCNGRVVGALGPDDISET